MGRHSKEARKRYRSKRKQLKQIKKSILQRGNQICNVITCKERSESNTAEWSSSDGGTTSVAISGVERLNTSSTRSSRKVCDQELVNNSSKTPKRATLAPSFKHRLLPFDADPLIVGLREYNTVRRRLCDILKKNGSLKVSD